MKNFISKTFRAAAANAVSRKLLTAAISFSAAVFISVYLFPAFIGFAICAGIFILCAASAILKRKNISGGIFPRGRGAGIILLPLAVGLLWSGIYGEAFIRPADKLAGQTAAVKARVTDYPRAGDGFSTVTIKITEPGYPHITCLLYSRGESFYVFDDTGGGLNRGYAIGGGGLSPGDEITVSLRFAAPQKTKTFDTDKYSSRGIFLRAYQRGDLSKTGRYKLAVIYFPKTLALYVRRAVYEALPADVSALETALLTGDKSELYKDRELSGAMGIAGVIHAVSVSGMHVSFLAGMVANLTGKRKKLTAGIAIPLIIIFIPMTGGGAAVIRAGFMQLCMLLAPLIRRESDPMTALFTVLAALLIINPAAAAGVSLQLSFACTAGIILVSGRISGRLTPKAPSRSPLIKWLTRTAVSSFSCTVGASIFTLPLSALYFGYVSIISPITNLLALSALSFCFSAGFGICIAYYIYAPLGTALGRLLAWLLRYAELVIKFLAKIPYAALFTGNNFFAWWLALAYAIFIVCYAGRSASRGNTARADGENHLHSGGGERRRFRPALPSSLAVITLCAAILLTELQMNVSVGYLIAVDVGQGEAIVLISGRSTAVIDCGGEYNGARQVIDCLFRAGRRHIDLLALTHLHSDHAAGAPELMERLDVDALCLPYDAPDDDGLLPSILAAAEMNNVRVYYISEDTDFSTDMMNIRVIAPVIKTGINERGLVFAVTAGNFSAFIMGDAGFPAETALLNNGELFYCDVLVVGHHGSKTASSDAFLAAISPKTALISVGGANTYGHPTSEALNRLRAAGAIIFRTDMNGDIEVRVR